MDMLWSARAREPVFHLHARIFPQAVPAFIDKGCRPCRHVGRETLVDPFTLTTVDNLPGFAQQCHMAGDLRLRLVDGGKEAESTR